MYNNGRHIVNFALAAICLLLAVPIAMPLAAEIAYNNAERLEGRLQYAGALADYRNAIRADPLSARYRSGYGAFLLRRSADQKGRIAIYWLEEAVRSFSYAAELNPRSAETELNMAQAKMRLFLYNVREKRLKDEAFVHFRNALKNDPNGFNISYSAGYSGIVAWKFLNDGERRLVLDRLRYSISLRPSYSRHIYPQLWRYTKDLGPLKEVTPDTLEANEGLYYFIVDNNLKELIPEGRARVDLFRERERPEEVSAERDAERRRIEVIKTGRGAAPAAASVGQEDWRGTDHSGKNPYVNGAMYWGGAVDAVIEMPPGPSVVRIKARGSPVEKVYPYMVVKLDAEEIGEAFAESPEWKEYSFKVRTDGGAKVLSVIFMNDLATDAEDRNLFVGEAVITKDGE
ncbi:MAG: carbohydrate-binding domain-containing protein [Candidatus Omnitrophota bacterium]